MGIAASESCEGAPLCFSSGVWSVHAQFEGSQQQVDEEEDKDHDELCLAG